MTKSKGFFEIKLNYRTGQVEDCKQASKEECIAHHPTNMDLNAWAKGARINTRFFLTTRTESFVYVRSDDNPTKEQILTWAKKGEY